MPKGFLESIVLHLLILGMLLIPALHVAKKEIVPSHPIPVIFDKIDKNATPASKKKIITSKKTNGVKPANKPKVSTPPPAEKKEKPAEVKKIPEKLKPLEKTSEFDSFIDEIKSTPTKTEQNFDSVLKDLTPEKYKKSDEATQEEVVSDSIQDKLAENFTVAEEDALRAQIMNNWLVPIGAKDIESMQVDIRIQVTPGGKIQDTEILHNKYYQRGNKAYEIFVKSAERAILKSSPLKLSDERMKVKSEIVFHFSPTDMF